jgi:hypothetical protein
MKLKTPWFSIEVKPVKRVKTGPPWCGSICNVCGEKIPGAEKSNHMLEMHPQYAIHTKEFMGGKKIKGCWCGTCGKSVGTVGNIATHYRECHPEVINQPTQSVDTESTADE